LLRCTRGADPCLKYLLAWIAMDQPNQSRGQWDRDEVLESHRAISNRGGFLIGPLTVERQC